MAQTLYFADGTKRVLLSESAEEFAEILEEYMGRDAARYFRELLEDAVDEAEEREYERGYNEGLEGA